MALSDFLTGIADAIRSKDGTTDPIPAADFAARIGAISGGGGGEVDALIDRSITEVASQAKTIGTYAFRGCTALVKADFTDATAIKNYAFYGCSALSALILRNADGVCTLNNANAITNTPIDAYNGYVYVPTALVGSYEAADNWSDYAGLFRGLESYTVDGTITGALDETKI